MPATEPPVLLPEAALALPGTPTIKRRLAVMVYEFFLLFAVEMLAVLLYLLVTGNRQDPLFQHGLKVYLFVLTGLYFTWCWRDSGHTLAMKTWRIKLVTPGHARLPWRVAIVRYLAAWGWFAPALIVCAAFGLHAKADIAIALALGVAAWAATAWLDPDRQFLHDRLAGTRQTGLPKPMSGKGNGKGKQP
jgi:uncharacterized RDD family membrane protein YckC